MTLSPAAQKLVRAIREKHDYKARYVQILAARMFHADAKASSLEHAKAALTIEELKAEREALAELLLILEGHL